MSNNPATPGYPDRRTSSFRPPVNPPNQNDTRNPPANMQRQVQYPGGFAIPRPNPGPTYHNQNPNVQMPNINTQVQNSQQYNGHRNSVMMSPGTYSSPYQPSPFPFNQNNSSYYHPPQPVMSQTDLQRKFYGTCHGCNQPNTDFAECQSCNQWLARIESQVNAHRALIQKQFCELCKLPKHVHHQIAACGKCGFPKPNVEELSKVAIKKEQSDSIFEDAKMREQLGLVCTNCNQGMEGFLKCPTYGEVATRMRKEREQVPYEDPNFKKLSDIVKDYSDKEKKLKPQIQKSTKPNYSADSGGVKELSNLTRELHIDSNSGHPVSNNQVNYNYGGYQGGYGGPPNTTYPLKQK